MTRAWVMSMMIPLQATHIETGVGTLFAPYVPGVGAGMSRPRLHAFGSNPWATR